MNKENNFQIILDELDECIQLCSIDVFMHTDAPCQTLKDEEEKKERNKARVGDKMASKWRERTSWSIERGTTMPNIRIDY